MRRFFFSPASPIDFAGTDDDENTLFWESCYEKHKK